MQTASSVKRDQYAIYAGLLILSAVIVCCAYRTLKASYLVNHKASVLFNQGDYENAIPYYEKSILSGLIQKKAAVNLFAAYEKTGKDDNILKLFDIVKNNHKDYGKLLDTDHTFDERYDGTLTLKGFLMYIAGYLESKGRFNDIITLLSENERLWDYDLNACMFMADSYRNTGRPDKAEKWYGNVINKKPKAIYPKFRFGEMLAWQGKFKEATKVFRSILTDHPDNRLTRIQLARTLASEGKFDEAIREYKHILGESL